MNFFRHWLNIYGKSSKSASAESLPSVLTGHSEPLTVPLVRELISSLHYHGPVRTLEFVAVTMQGLADELSEGVNDSECDGPMFRHWSAVRGIAHRIHNLATFDAPKLLEDSKLTLAQRFQRLRETRIAFHREQIAELERVMDDPQYARKRADAVDVGEL